MQSNELFGKMDALLHRHRRAEKSLGSESMDDLPVLTEVVSDGIDATPISLRAVPTSGPISSVQPWPDLEAIAETVRLATLERVPSQIEALISHRMSEEIGQIVERITMGMTTQLEATVRELVRDAVADAIDAELDQWRLRNTPPAISN